MSSDFCFPVTESFHKKLVQIGTVVSEKIRFEFLYVHDLGPSSRNDLDLQHGGKSKGTTCVVDRDVTAYMVVDRVLRFPTE